MTSTTQELTRSGGNVLNLELVRDAGSGLTRSVFTVSQLRANAFYIVDSPVPLTIRTNVANQSDYQEQTGEAFGVELGSLEVSYSTADVQPVTPLRVRVWVGYVDFLGFIDRRAQLPSAVVLELTTSTNDDATGLGIAGGLVSVPTATVAGAITLTPDSGVYADKWFPNYQIVGLLIANLTANTTIFLTDVYGNVVMPLFYGQVMRIPFTLLIASSAGARRRSSMFVYLSNASGSTVSVSCGLIMQTGQNLVV